MATLDMDDFAKQTVEINISSLQSIKNMIERSSEDRVFRFLQLNDSFIQGQNVLEFARRWQPP